MESFKFDSYEPRDDKSSREQSYTKERVAPKHSGKSRRDYDANPYSRPQDRSSHSHSDRKNHSSSNSQSNNQGSKERHRDKNKSTFKDQYRRKIQTHSKKREPNPNRHSNNGSGHKGKYDELTQHILESKAFAVLKKNHLDDKNSDFKEIIQKVGNVDVTSEGKYYAPETVEVKTAAAFFLKNFWDDANNCKLVEEEQKKKFKGRGFTRPGCISFVDTTISKKKFVFISISDPISNDKVAEAIEGMCNVLNGKQQNCIYQFADASSLNYSSLIETTLKALGTKIYKKYKPYAFCAEKCFTAILAKIFELKPRAVMNGITNIRFYPYQNDQQLPYYVDGPESTKWVEDKYILDSISCCESCQTNFPAILCILAGIKDIAATKEAKEPSASTNAATFFSPLPTPIAKIAAVNTPLTPIDDKKLQPLLVMPRPPALSLLSKFTSYSKPLGSAADAMPPIFINGIPLTPLNIETPNSEPGPERSGAESKMEVSVAKNSPTLQLEAANGFVTKKMKTPSGSKMTAEDPDSLERTSERRKVPAALVQMFSPVPALPFTFQSVPHHVPEETCKSDPTQFRFDM